MSVRLIKFEQQLAEIDWLVKEVKSQIENGVTPEEIAIIAPRHKYLEVTTKFLLQQNIPVSYIRENSVLEEPTIVALIDMVKLTHFIISNPEQANVYWLKVLSNSCWNLSSSTISKLSLIAFYSRLSWQEMLDLIQTNNNQFLNEVLTQKPHLKLQENELKNISQIYNFFKETSVLALQEPAEQILNRLLGVENSNMGAEDETEEDSRNNLVENYNTQVIQKVSENSKSSFISPFKDYYFDKARNKDDKNYLIFLANLRTLVDQLRKMNSVDQILINHWLDSLIILKARNKPLTAKISIGNSAKSVNLITGHSAKGLEFETVFLIHCNKSVWAGKGKSNTLSLPKNLNLQAESENRDDKIRLFFVALTRAKQNLFLTYSDFSLQNEPLEKLTFLDEIEITEEEISTNIMDLNKHWFNLETQAEFIQLTEPEFLSPELQGYQLSVTHLNNFLDIEKGGPSYFLSTNLLRFPQAKNESATFGTLMHESLASFYKEFSSIQTLPNFPFLLDSFKTLLNRQKLSINQKDKFYKKATRYLKDYFEARKFEFNFNDKIEFDFRNQGVILGEAKLSGKIDKMVITEENKTISVIDLKTGKYLEKWLEKGNSYEAAKSDNYKRQLVFYKLLVENSREFKGRYVVDQGGLDFIESDLDTGLVHFLHTNILNEEAKQLELLIQKVWSRIMRMDFSLPSQNYKAGLEGKYQFIQDLLEE